MSILLRALSQAQKDTLLGGGVLHNPFDQDSILIDDDQLEPALALLNARHEGSVETGYENLLEARITFETDGDVEVAPAPPQPSPPVVTRSYRIRIRKSSVNRLQREGIVFYELDGCIVVDQAQLDRVLTLLEAKIVEETPAPYENMSDLKIDTLSSRRERAGRQAAAGESRNAMTMDPAKAAARDRYVKICTNNKSAKQTVIAGNLEGLQKKLPFLRSQFFTISRQQAVAESKESLSEERLKAEFARLQQVNKLTDVRIGNGVLLLYTDLLYATDPETESQYEIGQFLIIIRTDGREAAPVRWLNQTRQVDGVVKGMQAPYVTADGTCFANEIEETLIQLVAQFEFAAVAELAIQFIETINDDEAGRYIDRWPSSNL
ncbi:MAG: hypothetical protein K2W82_16450 [Candidatus Obscuribacterales bacterium]|nr:hypothetical protein [Candidatus Obscuribacterales bacterium]